MSKTSKTQTERDEAIAILKKLGVKPGARVYTTVNHVSKSGMSRRISVFVVTRNKSFGKTEAGITNITHLVGRVTGYRHTGNLDGLVVGGAGMDMGFHLVYTLGRIMFPKGGPLTKTTGGRAAQAKQSGESRETDGGYLLKQEWL